MKSDTQQTDSKINAHGYKKLSSHDLSASLVVFMVAVPLSLGIALASGVTPAAGLITAIIGGVIAGFISGAPLVVSGPAAGLTAMVLETVNKYGITMLGPITFLAGCFQLLFGGLRLGKFVALIPMAVLEGVLCAIGAIITMGQLHVLLGYKAPAGFTNCAKQFFPRVVEVASSSGPSAVILGIGLTALAVQILWNKHYKGRLPIPGALPAVVIGTVLSLKFDLPRVVLAPLGGTMFDAFSRFIDMQWTSQVGILAVPAIGLALVAAAETLLTARAVDLLAAKKNISHVTQPNQELLAQGVGNICSGLLGGIPMTGVMVRSAAGVASGAQSRYSTILHGLWVAVFVSALPWLISSIPLTVLASILVLTGVRLLNLKHFAHLIRHDVKAASLWAITAGTTMATDLLKGLAAGLAAWAVTLAWARYKSLASRSSSESVSVNAD